MASHAPKSSPRPTARPRDLVTEASRRPAQSNTAVAEAAKRRNPHVENGFLDEVKHGPPTFAGLEDARHQTHDERIQDLVAQFNLDKAGFIGATPDQALGIPDLDPAVVKSWLLQESGGGDRRSRAAWATDPGQVNVPGDWGAPKGDDYMGLSKPRRRNEGDLDTNMRAAVTWLTRKGFSRSGKAPSELEGGQEFGGWRRALENYNGRGERMRNGKRYRENYAARILDRANEPDQHRPIPLGR